MKFDHAQITKLARETGFPADNLEKVLRLRELLTELHKHPFLTGKLVLKGGTALDVIYPKELERRLYPLLRANDRPTAPEMLKAVSPLLATVLDHKREAEYLEAMAAGHYRPELLFVGEAAIVERLQLHPALLWKADNVARHLSRSKKNS